MELLVINLIRGSWNIYYDNKSPRRENCYKICLQGWRCLYWLITTFLPRFSHKSNICVTDVTAKISFLIRQKWVPWTTYLEEAGWEDRSQRCLECFWINSVHCPHWSVSEQTWIPEKSLRTTACLWRWNHRGTAGVRAGPWVCGPCWCTGTCI